MIFLDCYSTEAQCPEASAKARWPVRLRCPDCGHTGHCYLAQRDVHQCNRCKRKVSLTSGTLFAQTRLPLRTWFLAIYLMTHHKNGISALALRRQLGASYYTAWLLKHLTAGAREESGALRLVDKIGLSGVGGNFRPPTGIPLSEALNAADLLQDSFG